MKAQLIYFLQEKLAIPPDSIMLALRQSEESSDQLPMVLWQYGLISIEQLELLFDWLDAASI